jgi:nicotinamidase-related amidase
VSGNVSDVSNRAAIQDVVLQILKDLTADWDTDYAGAIGPDTLLIGGVNTNTCVLASVFGAYSRDLRAVGRRTAASGHTVRRPLHARGCVAALLRFS